MSEKRNVLFILDGAPLGEAVCSLGDCFEKSVGTFEVVGDDSHEFVATVQLCDGHAKKLGTGYFSAGGR